METQGVVFEGHILRENNPKVSKKIDEPLTTRFCAGNGDFSGGNANMDKKVRKVRGFANIRYNDKITENPKNDVFAKNNAEFEI